MNILSIRNGHDASFALVTDGIVKKYFKEERFSKKKRDYNNDNIFDICLKNIINDVDYIHLCIEGDVKLYYKKIYKFNKDIRVIVPQSGDCHHLYHASVAFYNSGFEKSLVVVVDASNNIAESVYVSEYPHTFTRIYGTEISSDMVGLSGVCHFYDTTTRLLDLFILESGKSMGLSSYGERISNYTQFFDNKDFPTRITKDIINDNSNEFYADLLGKAYSDEYKLEITKNNYKIYADYCKEVQVQTQTAVSDLIKKVVDETGIINVCISGGYGMNVVSNYNLIKQYPNINFYFEPLCDDSGISIGAAMYYYRKISNSMQIYPIQTTSFHGFKYEVQKYKGVTKSIPEISQLLYDNKSVAIYSGLAESGQRALGNRSILFNALNPDAKDIVNGIKKREWYRPFAAIVLEEDADKYFEMDRIKSSPYMTVCFPVKSDLIPGVTHVDNTCRIQTISSGYLYDILLEFKKLSGHGILLNTSFNLAGEPLVETPEDAFKTLKNSSLDYLWFEETKQLFN